MLYGRVSMCYFASDFGTREWQAACIHTLRGSRPNHVKVSTLLSSFSLSDYILYYSTDLLVPSAALLRTFKRPRKPRCWRKIHFSSRIYSVHVQGQISNTDCGAGISFSQQYVYCARRCGKSVIRRRFRAYSAIRVRACYLSTLTIQ